jgi:hypothetical protein
MRSCGLRTLDPYSNSIGKLQHKVATGKVRWSGMNMTEGGKSE